MTARRTAAGRISSREARELLWPIARRFPAYLRLGWALGREPAIPHRNKTLLVGAALYTISPAQAVVGFVPVLGQLDSALLYLIGLRHALNHCPPRIAARHLVRVRIQPEQLDEDLATLRNVAIRVASGVGAAVGARARFAGRVASSFARRAARRLMKGSDEWTPSASRSS